MFFSLHKKPSSSLNRYQKSRNIQGETDCFLMRKFSFSPQKLNKIALNKLVIIKCTEEIVMFKLISIFLTASVLFSLVLTSSAYAYIDPGAGSMMFQILIAFVVGTLFSLKLWFTKAKTFMKTFFNKNDNATKSTE